MLMEKFKEQNGKLAEKEAPPIWKDISARDANRKVYTIDGRLKKAVFFASSVHVQAEDGSYQEASRRCCGLSAGGQRVLQKAPSSRA